MFSLIDGSNAPGQRRICILRTEGSGDRNLTVMINPGNSRTVSDDDQGSPGLALRDGKKHLVAQDPQGGQIFAHPVNTPRNAMHCPPCCASGWRNHRT